MWQWLFWQHSTGYSGTEQLRVCPLPYPHIDLAPASPVPPRWLHLTELQVKPMSCGRAWPRGSAACATCQAGRTHSPLRAPSTIPMWGQAGGCCRHVLADGCSGGVSTGAAFHLPVCGSVEKPKVNTAGRTRRARCSERWQC